MKTLVILFTKLLIYIFSKFGRGTSLPGLIALKLKPDIMTDLIMPRTVIAITGSNGKTTTAEMVAKALAKSEMKVFFNKEGSNQTEGIASLLLRHCNLTGVLNFDAAVLECDERYTKEIFRYIKPTHFVIINLYRDQLTRNAHPYYVLQYLKEAIDMLPDSTLILNADDPLITSIGNTHKNTLYFGMEKNSYSTEKTDALYNDCHYCPLCKSVMHYDYFQFSHLGKYSCTGCDFKKPDTSFTISEPDLDTGEIHINGCRITVGFASLYNIYNVCAAFSAAVCAGMADKAIAKALSEFVSENGRLVHFEAGKNKGILLTSKHENSTSYNQNLEYVSRADGSVTLVILIDEISRKYYTNETGWLWDVSFEMIQNTSIRKVILCGNYCYDLEVRFNMANITSAEIITEPDIGKMVEMISVPTNDRIFVITCFSDKDKLYSRVRVNSPTAK